MANYASIQAHINRGYGKAGSILGQACHFYRPASATAPIGMPYQTAIAQFDANPAFNFPKPVQYGKPILYGLFDPTPCLPGDYVISADGRTFFIASIEPLHQTMMVLCNRIVTVTRPNPQPVGSSYYGGVVRDPAPGQSTPILTGWPASVLITSRVSSGMTKLPGDVDMPRVDILLPEFAATSLRSMDGITDDRGVIYTLESVESSLLGWRLLAQQTTT